MASISVQRSPGDQVTLTVQVEISAEVARVLAHKLLRAAGEAAPIVLDVGEGFHMKFTETLQG